jgi:hypothetical protein
MARVGNDFTPASRRLILLRDQGRCAWCGRPWGDALNIHHRVLRSQGGTGSPENGISLCGSGTTGCHGEAHHNRRWAAESGLIVPSHLDPATVPVSTWRGLLLLDSTGGAHRVGAGHEDGLGALGGSGWDWTTNAGNREP